MKKKLCGILIFVFLMAGCICGCSGKTASNPKMVLGTDMVKYHSKGTEDFGFNVNLVSDKRDMEIEFVSFSGENTQGLAVQLKDDTYDYLRDMKKDGYYKKILGFVCHTGDEQVRIDGVTLKIDGEEKEFEFKTPIQHSLKVEENSSIQTLGYPLFISTNSYDSTEYEFKYCTEEDITVTDFSFNDFLTVKDAVICVDNREIGRLEDTLPREVEKGSTIKIKGFLDFTDMDSFTKYDSIYCDAQFSYVAAGNNEIQTVHSNLVSQSVSNEQDAQQVISLLLENE